MLYEMLASAASESPGREAVEAHGTAVSYGELRTAVDTPAADVMAVSFCPLTAETLPAVQQLLLAPAGTVPFRCRCFASTAAVFPTRSEPDGQRSCRSKGRERAPWKKVFHEHAIAGK